MEKVLDKCINERTLNIFAMILLFTMLITENISLLTETAFRGIIIICMLYVAIVSSTKNKKIGMVQFFGFIVVILQTTLLVANISELIG